jgi:hypothetical protein
MTQAEVCDRQICKYYSGRIMLVTTPHNVKFRHTSVFYVFARCIVI